MGDLFGGGVFVDTRHKHLAARGEGNQLAVVAQSEVADATEILLHQLLCVLVIDDFDIHLLRLTANALRIDFAHKAIAQQAVVGHAQKADRMCLEIRHLLHLFEVVGRSLIHIETAVVALTQKHDLLIARQVTRIAVFPNIGRHDRVGFLFGVVIHDVARYRGDMVLAPHVLTAFAVVIKERLAVFVERHATYRHRHHLLWSTAFGAHLV